MKPRIVTGVRTVIAEIGSPTVKKMGTVMKNIMTQHSRPRGAVSIEES